jgi:hypothetical protein
MRKLLMLALAVLLVPTFASATDLTALLSHTIITTDNNSNIRDTVTTNILNTNHWQYSGYHYYWRTINVGIQDFVDSIFAADTLYIMTYYSHRSDGDWTLFDSTKIILNGQPDTTLLLATRVSYDSATYCGNLWRITLVNGFSLGDGDTAGIVGNTYDYDVNVWFEGKP